MEISLFACKPLICSSEADVMRQLNVFETENRFTIILHTYTMHKTKGSEKKKVPEEGRSVNCRAEKFLSNVNYEVYFSLFINRVLPRNHKSVNAFTMPRLRGHMKPFGLGHING